jgi:hypothetical protein
LSEPSCSFETERPGGEVNIEQGNIFLAAVHSLKSAGSG